METCINMIKTGFLQRYKTRKAFIEEPKTEKLVRLLLQGDRIERIMSFCAVGQAPLRAVVYDVEEFAEKNDIVVDGKLSDEWKQDVGRLIGIIVYFYGYVSNVEEDLQQTPKYFHYAATFQKQV